MLKSGTRGSRAMMRGVSLLALCGFGVPGAAFAQATDVGAAGKALTAGVVSTTTGSISDGGGNGGVFVNPGVAAVVTATGAVINATNANTIGLGVFGSAPAGATQTVTATGANNIRSTGSSALVAQAQNENVSLDLSAGGSTFVGGGNTPAVQANSNAGSVTINNGANTITSAQTGLSAQAATTATVDSVGGSISAGSGFSGAYGIYAQTDTGALTIGSGSGVTTAVTTGAGGVGVGATTNSGTIAIRTGAGGTIDGGATGVTASTPGSGAITVNVGAAIGSTTAPTNVGALVQTQQGALTFNSTAAISGVAGGVQLGAQGPGAVNVSTVGVAQTATTANLSASAVNILTGAGATGAINYTLNGASAVTSAAGIGTGVSIIASGAAPITFTGTNAGASIRGGSRGLSLNSAGGDVTATYAGSAQGGTSFGVGLITSGAGSLSLTDTGTISGAQGVIATASGGTGAITLGSTANPLGAITATGGVGVQALGGGAVSVTTGQINQTGGGAPTFASNMASGGATTGVGVIAVSTGSSVNVVTNGTLSGNFGGVLAKTTAGVGGVNVVTNGAITTLAGRGIEADSFAGPITVTANAQITTAGAAANTTNGLQVTKTGGAGDVTVSSVGISAPFQAVAVSSQAGSTGNVSYTLNGANTVTSQAQAVSVSNAGTGSATLNSAAGSLIINTTPQTSNGVSNGAVISTSGGGALVVNLQGAITGGNVALQSVTTTGGGTQTINIAGPITGGTGINAVAGAGALTIGSASQRLGAVTATGGTGVTAIGAGDVNVYLSSITQSGGAAPALTDNVVNSRDFRNGVGTTVSSSAGNVLLNVAGPITASQFGVLGQITGGAGSLNITTSGTINATSGRGIEADNVGGVINVTSTGAITAGTNAIQATNTGAGAINILATGPLTSTTLTALNANSTGSGAVTLGSASQRIGTISAATTGVFAGSGGNVAVYTGQITGGTRGVLALVQGAGANGTLLIDTSGPVVAGSSFGITAVNNGTLSANTLAINASGTVTSTGGSAISAQSFGGDITIRSVGVTANAGNNQFWDGIFADGRGDARVSVSTTGPVVGGYNGIEAYSLGTTARSGVTVSTAGSVTGANGQSAIFANVAGLGSASISTAAGTTLNSLNGNGVYAFGSAASTATNLTIANQATIGSASARTLNGLFAQTVAGNAGAIAIDSSGGSIFATQRGVAAVAAGAGSVTIGGAGGVSSAINTSNTGIFGSTTSGALSITTAAGGTVNPGAAIGILAQSQTGAITINQAGAIGATGTGGTVGAGILATIASGAAPLTINSTGAIYVTPGTGFQSAGIYAFHGGTGAVSVTSSGVVDPGAYGVVVQGAGDVSYTGTGGVVEGGIGLYAASTGAGVVNVSTTGTTTITGDSGPGAQIQSAGGNATAVIGGPVNGATDGLILTTSGAGATSLTVNGPVTAANGVGVSETAGTGGAALTVRSSVIAQNGSAVNITSGAGANITLASGSLIAGATTATSGVINIATASGASSTVTVQQGATVQSTSGSTSDVAIRATGGSVVVNNNGLIAGRVDFSALTGANTGQLNAAAGTTILTGGVSTFSAGDDNFVNSGDLATLGASTVFDFRGGTNLFVNNGRILTGFNPVLLSGSNFTLLGVTTFTNTGLIQLMNGVAGDSVTAPGSNYVGSGAARLSIDTVVGGPGSASDVLTVGRSSGSTLVTIRNASTAAGGFNPNGTIIVAGATHAGDFVLDPGSSNYDGRIFGGALAPQGLFFSQLAVSPAGNTVLVSAPRVQAYQFATLGAQAQTLWYAASEAGDHRSDARDTGGRFGLWGRLSGSTIDRDASRTLSLASNTYRYDTGYDQDVFSATIGYDTGRTTRFGALTAGASAAFADSRAKFSTGGASVLLHGAALRGYAQLTRGDVFVGGSLGVDLLQSKLKAPGVTGYAAQKPDVTSAGGSVELGLRHAWLWGTTVEPTVGLDYVTSTIDDISAPGASLRYADPESLRLSIGARLMGPLSRFSPNLDGRYTLSVRAADDVLASNKLTLASSGPTLGLSDGFNKAYGEVRGGVEAQGKGRLSGWSAFTDLRGRFGDRYSEEGVSLGVRRRF